ncbi:hypothetical protein Tco_0759770 [Tanacetum coccineum]
MIEKRFFLCVWAILFLDQNTVHGSLASSALFPGPSPNVKPLLFAELFEIYSGCGSHGVLEGLFVLPCRIPHIRLGVARGVGQLVGQRSTCNRVCGREYSSAVSVRPRRLSGSGDFVVLGPGGPNAVMLVMGGGGGGEWLAVVAGGGGDGAGMCFPRLFDLELDKEIWWYNMELFGLASFRLRDLKFTVKITNLSFLKNFKNPKTSSLVVNCRGVLLDSHLCPLCNAAMEDVQLVFFRCDVARVVLRKICRWWDLVWQEICSFSDWDAWFLSFRLSSRLKSILEAVFYVAWWRIWRLRN